MDKTTMKGHMEHIKKHLRLDDFENSPIKVLKIYFKENKINELKTPRIPSKFKNIQVEETEIFNNRVTSGKSLKEIIGGMRYFKDVEERGVNNLMDRKKGHERNGLSEIGFTSFRSSISLHTNAFTTEKSVCSTKRTFIGKQAEIKRNQSDGKVSNHSKDIYKKLEDIRNKYKEDVIKNCRKMTKLNRWN